jgi:hypothetical protein
LALLVEILLLERFLFSLFGFQFGQLIIPDKPPTGQENR